MALGRSLQFQLNELHLFGGGQGEKLRRNFIACFIIQKKPRRKKVKMAEVMELRGFIMCLNMYFFFAV